MRSELFNAGSDWQSELATPAVASFAVALTRLHAELPERLASDQPDIALGNVIAEARQASMRAGFSAANALAERAFARLLLATVDGLVGDPAAVSDRWIASRGSTTDLISEFAGEVLGQYARHVTDREAGRLLIERSVDASRILSTDASRTLSTDLAERATSIGRSVARNVLSDSSDVSSNWARIIDQAFAVGRALPGDDT